jgi:tRNA-Thr(GGU) m(6)t(6)A37 methyltransferase TsaA
MEPIGIIESCFKDRFGTPRQPGLVSNAWARLQLDKKLHPEQALIGLEKFSHLWLIFLFHQNTNNRYHAKVHPPRLQGKSIGVFATRSPHRPNPIGLSLVKLEKIEGDSLILSGADLIDGTPILDIKPYLPEIEAIADAKTGWLDGIETREIQVKWSEEIKAQVKDWSLRIHHPELQSLIEKTLILDPRPLVYRDQSTYRQTHAVRIFDGDIHFKFLSETLIEIIEIKKLS